MLPIGVHRLEDSDGSLVLIGLGFHGTDPFQDVFGRHVQLKVSVFRELAVRDHVIEMHLHAIG
jgi:hypothetical protein